jgi:hypothetical protein
LYSYVTAINTTVIALQSGESYTQRTLINITINGNTPQSYPIDLLANNPIDIFYETNNGTYATIFSNPSGTITISSIGNVGEKITGSFDAIATHMSYTDTIRISGTFSVTRDN